MSVSRNAACPCGSGKKYKKCCLAQDEKVAAETRAKQRQAEQAAREQRRAEEATFARYAAALDELSNRANDLIGAGQWVEAEACCRELLDQFPKEIDGHHRSYERCKAMGDWVGAKTHAEETLRMVESTGDFDPDFLAELEEDIAHFEDAIRAPATGD